MNRGWTDFSHVFNCFRRCTFVLSLIQQFFFLSFFDCKTVALLFVFFKHYHFAILLRFRSLDISPREFFTIDMTMQSGHFFWTSLLSSFNYTKWRMVLQSKVFFVFFNLSHISMLIHIASRLFDLRFGLFRQLFLLYMGIITTSTDIILP